MANVGCFGGGLGAQYFAGSMDRSGATKADLKHGPMGITYLPSGFKAPQKTTLAEVEAMSPEERDQRQLASSQRLEEAKRRLDETKKARDRPGWMPMTQAEARSNVSQHPGRATLASSDTESIATVDSQATLIGNGSGHRGADAARRSPSRIAGIVKGMRSMGRKNEDKNIVR